MFVIFILTEENCVMIILFMYLEKYELHSCKCSTISLFLCLFCCNSFVMTISLREYYFLTSKGKWENSSNNNNYNINEWHEELWKIMWKKPLAQPHEHKMMMMTISFVVSWGCFDIHSFHFYFICLFTSQL